MRGGRHDGLRLVMYCCCFRCCVWRQQQLGVVTLDQLLLLAVLVMAARVMQRKTQGRRNR